MSLDFSSPIMRSGKCLFLACGLIWGVVFAESVYADQPCSLIPTSAEIKERAAHYRDLLIQKLYPALEDELEARLLKVRRGEESDERIRADFQATFNDDSQLEPLLSEWVRLYPRSYSARVARAFYYVSTGHSKRGREFSNKTSSEQFHAMEEQLSKARMDVDAAIPLSEEPTLAYAKLIDLARFNGQAVKLVDELNKKFPRSLAIKVTAVTALNPKWGGSLDQLNQLAIFSEVSGMSKDEFLVVKYYIDLEKGNYYEVVTKQLAKAANHYSAAGKLCRLSAPLKVASELSYKIEDWNNLIELSNEILLLDPTSRDAYQKRGWGYEKTGRMPVAIKDYEIAANLGAAWAQNKLGWLLWQGTDLPKDTTRAKALFEQAASQGNQTAKANLRALNVHLGNAPQKM